MKITGRPPILTRAQAREVRAWWQRKRQMLTQQQMAKRMGVSVKTLKWYADGLHKNSFD
jgi:DNA-binding transcriptional regulator YiaG